jgi:hypothetical protein
MVGNFSITRVSQEEERWLKGKDSYKKKESRRRSNSKVALLVAMQQFRVRVRLVLV